GRVWGRRGTAECGNGRPETPPGAQRGPRPSASTWRPLGDRRLIPEPPLQSRFDGFRELLRRDGAGHPLQLFAVLGDQHAGRVADQAAELVGGFFVGDENRIVHRQLLALHVEAHLIDPRRHDTLALFIHGQPENDEALLAVFLLHLDERGDFAEAGGAPGGPKIHQYHLALVIAERYVLTAEILQGEFGR